MKVSGVLFFIGTLLVLSENAKAFSVFFYAGSFLSLLNYIISDSMGGYKTSNTSIVRPIKTMKKNTSYHKTVNQSDDSHLIPATASIIIADSLFDSDDSFSSITSSFSDTETTAINPANGLPMVSGIGSVDVMGNPYGSDSMSDMVNTFDDSSMFSDNTTTSIDSFDSFDSSNSFSSDDTFSSFDDSSSMNDDW